MMREQFNALLFMGMQIMESPYLEQDGEPYQERRSWRIRLFSLPWRPWKATYTVVPRVPHRGFVQIGPRTIVMHPQTVRALRTEIKQMNPMQEGR